MEIVGAKRRFGAEMCVASAGMRRRLAALGLEGRRCEVEVPFLKVGLRILRRRIDFVVELEMLERMFGGRKGLGRNI